jgi:hypothetical protein
LWQTKENHKIRGASDPRKVPDRQKRGRTGVLQSVPLQIQSDDTGNLWAAHQGKAFDFFLGHRTTLFAAVMGMVFQTRMILPIVILRLLRCCTNFLKNSIS